MKIRVDFSRMPDYTRPEQYKARRQARRNRPIGEWDPSDFDDGGYDDPRELDPWADMFGPFDFGNRD